MRSMNSVGDQGIGVLVNVALWTKALLRGRSRVALIALGLVGVVGIASGLGGGESGQASNGDKAGAKAQPASEPGSASKNTLDTAAAQRLDFDVTTTATGEIAAAKQLEIRNPLERETTITELVDEGKVVKAGDVLIRLNDDTLKTQLDEESLQLETSKAAVIDADESYKIQLSENESTIRQATLKLELSKLELDQWKQGLVESKRQELESALERTQKDEVRLREKLEKARGLQEKGYYSLDQLKQDELSLDLAVAALEKAKLDNQIYWDFEFPKEKQKRESEVTQAAGELERAQRQNNSKQVSKEAELKNRKRSLQIREEKFKKYQEQVAQAVIRAPTDGLVVYASSMQSQRGGWSNEGPLQIGSKVYPNQSLLALPDTSEMVASVRIHESLASLLKPGQLATIKVDALGGERFQGKVESIGILAEQTNRWMDPNLREYTVRILLDLPKGDSARPDPAKMSSEKGELAKGDPKVSEIAPKPGVPDTSRDQPTTQTSTPPPPTLDKALAKAEGEVAKPEPTPASGAIASSEKPAASKELGADARSKQTHSLKPSMRCEAEIMLEQVRDVLAVPIQSVFNEGPLRYVHVAEGSRFARRPIQVGRRSERFAEVKAGLTASEMVLLRKPAPGELIARPWKAEELATVGLMTNDQGQIVPAKGAGKPGTKVGSAGAQGSATGAVAAKGE